ncbi:ATP-binding protein [Mycobacterium sp. KBS0706]|uniref:AAA family ATPase n=1 Tax=Mycobacterium sp. KBS0706 TaxID=2578109 RepID=UPI00118033A6|nr:AAA family ATPase [Mycobacterium sp. KBS0706]TSD86112.1 ATP-binding protein [Mycobacterium sp. KBS0706]
MIVHLNGWPGVGKLTVARLLAPRLQARLIDNHLLHDVAIRCTGIDDPARWPLYETVRAAADQVLADRPRSETFVMTNALCIGSPRECEAWRQVVALAETRAVPLVPVVLEADATVLRSRVQSLERQGRKLTDPDALAAMIRADRLLKPDVPERLDLDTSRLAAADAAAAIEAHLLAVRGLLAPADARHLTLVTAP